MLGATFLLAFLGLTSAATLYPRQAIACNNSPDLCSKPYSSIAQLGAHDSPFLRDASTGDSTSGNQYFNSTVQLSAGVRMLTAQVHQSSGQWHLCHTSCDLLDAGLLSTWLSEIKGWMDNHPNDVVTLLLVNSDNATPAELAGEFTKSGITQYAYTPPSISSAPATWPTLQTLISDGTRLMTFVASLDKSQIDSTNSYLMDEFTFIFENPFTNTSPSNFTCLPDRPSGVKGDISTALSANLMPLMNHFLDSAELFGVDVPNADAAGTTNSPGNAVGALGLAATQCRTAYGKVPNFLLVDFFDQGPAISTVDNLNGVTNPVGRTTPPSSNAVTSGASRSTSAFLGVINLVKLVKQGQHPTLGAWIWAGGDWTLGGINLSGGKVIQ
jgi:hypothetical protein